MENATRELEKGLSDWLESIELVNKDGKVLPLELEPDPDKGED